MTRTRRFSISAAEFVALCHHTNVRNIAKAERDAATWKGKQEVCLYADDIAFVEELRAKAAR